MSAIARHAQPGITAVKENWRPFLLIQASALVVLALFYTVPSVRVGAEWLAHAKQSGGLVLAAVTTIVASVGLPELAKKLVGGRPSPRSEVVFLIGFFGMVGVIVDVLYMQLGHIFGTEVSLYNVLRKLAFDQGIFCVALSIPLTTAMFAWKEGRFNVGNTVKLLSHGGFAVRYWPVLITCWAFWIPVLSAVYSMPPDLQFWLYLFTQAAWSLLLVGISARQAELRSAVHLCRGSENELVD